MGDAMRSIDTKALRQRRMFIFSWEWIFAASVLISGPAFGDKHPIDGTYDARVRTDSGTYRVPVEVEDGQVTHIRWPNGGRMRVRGADLDGDEANGSDSRGNRLRIELEDLEYDPADDAEDDD
jgi:hypothetical protein